MSGPDKVYRGTRENLVLVTKVLKLSLLFPLNAKLGILKEIAALTVCMSHLKRYVVLLLYMFLIFSCRNCFLFSEFYHFA